MAFVCSVCGELHEGLAARTYRRPDPWVALTEEERAQGQSSDDLCRTPDGQFFVRCVMELPLIGGPEPTFEFGVWGSLGETNFWRYVEGFDDEAQAELGPLFSYLSNEVRGFPDSFALKSEIHPQNGRQRPLMVLESSDHPLALAQRNGISFEKVLAIIHPD